MERIDFISVKHGRKTRLGYWREIGGISFAILPVKAERTVYFGIPGAHTDFLQVSAEPIVDGDVESACQSGIDKIEKTNPQSWVDGFSAQMLEGVRAKRIKAHREFILALLEEHRVYKGKDWK